tara:strand:+ start:222 stop:602 length:381 start_codon:yes stop_codon:yes gene_type:complete
MRLELRVIPFLILGLSCPILATADEYERPPTRPGSGWDVMSVAESERCVKLWNILQLAEEDLEHQPVDVHDALSVVDYNYLVATVRVIGEDWNANCAGRSARNFDTATNNLNGISRWNIKAMFGLE